MRMCKLLLPHTTSTIRNAFRLRALGQKRWSLISIYVESLDFYIGLQHHFENITITEEVLHTSEHLHSARAKDLVYSTQVACRNRFPSEGVQRSSKNHDAM